MANELRLKGQLQFNPSTAGQSGWDTELQDLLVTMTGEAFSAQVQNIPTSDTAISVTAAIGTWGWVLLINLDPTNYIEVGLSLQPAVRLNAGGGFALFRADAALYAIANTAACDLLFFVFED